jgi:hypothetical protein
MSNSGESCRENAGVCQQSLFAATRIELFEIRIRKSGRSSSHVLAAVRQAGMELLAKGAADIIERSRPV